MVQGVKLGEGGQFFGLKVYLWVVKICYLILGVGFIFLFLYYDIYFIEDFKQFIYDFKCVNFWVWIYVKLVVEIGVGIVVVGVLKVKVDVVFILGYDGGIGVVLLILIKYVGGFWELGLVEV